KGPVNVPGARQQRLALARAWARAPALVLADEPVASLAPANTRVVMDALLRINKHFGITVICNLHSLDLARSYCDRVIGIAAGRVVFEGTPEMLTQAVARELFGLDGGDEALPAPTAMPEPIPAFAEAATA